MLNVFSLTWTVGSQGKIKGRTLSFEIILETVGKRLGQGQGGCWGTSPCKKKKTKKNQSVGFVGFFAKGLGKCEEV